MSETTSDDDLAERVFGHYERWLGEPGRSWTHTADGEGLPVQVLLFAHQPLPETTTYATFGLSKTALRQPSESLVREESSCARTHLSLLAMLQPCS